MIPIKTYPALYFQGNRQYPGAYRVWLLARALDAQGSRKISRVAVRDALRDFGINPRNIRRWVGEAIRIGLLTPHNYRLSGDRVYFILSLPKGAVILGSPDVGLPAIIKDGAALFRKGWKALIWAGNLTTTRGRPVSRRVLHNVTRVHRSTQWRYQKAVPVGVIKNTERRRMAKSKLTGYQEFVNPLAYISIKGFICTPKPHIRNVNPAIAELGRRGRGRIYQRQLEYFSYLWSGNAAIARGKSTFIKLFHETKESLERARKRYLKHKEQPGCPIVDELYLRKPSRSTRVNIWAAVAI